MSGVGIHGAVKELSTCSSFRWNNAKPLGPHLLMGFRFPTELFAFIMYLDIIKKKKNREGLISHKHLSELPRISYISHLLEYV